MSCFNCHEQATSGLKLHSSKLTVPFKNENILGTLGLVTSDSCGEKFFGKLDFSLYNIVRKEIIAFKFFQMVVHLKNLPTWKPQQKFAVFISTISERIPLCTINQILLIVFKNYCIMILFSSENF